MTGHDLEQWRRHTPAYCATYHHLRLRLDDEALRVAVGLRLGVNACEPHECRCGTMVKANSSPDCLVSWVLVERPGTRILTRLFAEVGYTSE